MNYWISLLGAALAVAPGSLCAQSAPPVVISGQLAGVPDSTTLAVFEPLPGVPMNYFFADGPNEAVVRSGQFRYALRHQQPGFVRFNGKFVPHNLAFVEPGAAISFTLTPGVGNAHPTVTYGGTNAAANNLLEQGRLLSGGPPDGARIRAVLAGAPTARAVLAALEAEMAPPKTLLTAALRQHQISQRCYEVLTAEVEQRLLYWSGEALAFHFSDPAKANLHLAMPDAEARQLAQTLCTRFDPLLPRYRYSSLGNLGLVAGLREKGVLPGPTPTAHTWAGYAKQFEPVNSAMSRYRLPAGPGPKQGRGR